MRSKPLVHINMQVWQVWQRKIKQQDNTEKMKSGRKKKIEKCYVIEKKNKEGNKVMSNSDL